MMPGQWCRVTGVAFVIGSSSALSTASASASSRIAAESQRTSKIVPSTDGRSSALKAGVKANAMEKSVSLLRSDEAHLAEQYDQDALEEEVKVPSVVLLLCACAAAHVLTPPIDLQTNSGFRNLGEKKTGCATTTTAVEKRRTGATK